MERVVFICLFVTMFTTLGFFGIVKISELLFTHDLSPEEKFSSLFLVDPRSRIEKDMERVRLVFKVLKDDLVWAGQTRDSSMVQSASQRLINAQDLAKQVKFPIPED